MQWNGLKLVGSTRLASKVVLFLLCSLGQGVYLTSLHLSSLMYKIRKKSDLLPEGKVIRSDVSVYEGCIPAPGPGGCSVSVSQRKDQEGPGGINVCTAEGNK